MRIKGFEDFVTEKASVPDAYPYILRDFLKVLSEHSGDTEYVSWKKDGRAVFVTGSSVEGKKISELQNEAMFCLWPKRFDPRIAICSDRRFRQLTPENFKFIREAEMDDRADKIYDAVKSIDGIGGIGTVYLTVKY